MGDRAMAEIRTDDGALYFYTHWSGYRLPTMASDALKAAEVRKGDDSYALRIVLDRLIRDCGSRDKETGCGVFLQPRAEDEYNADNPSVLIDLRPDRWGVRTLGRHGQSAAPVVNRGGDWS